MDSPNMSVARIANGTDPPATIRIAQESIGKQNDSAPSLRASKWSNRSPADSLPIICVIPTMPPMAAAVVRLRPFDRKMGTRLMMSAILPMAIIKVAATSLTKCKDVRSRRQAGSHPDFRPGIFAAAGPLGPTPGAVGLRALSFALDHGSA